MKKDNGIPSVDCGASGREECSQCEQSDPPQGFIAASGKGFGEFKAVRL